MAEAFEEARDGLLLTGDADRMQVELIHRWLAEGSYWAAGRDLEVVRRSLAGSRCYGVFRDDVQVGFARAVTDEATFAWICDVFVAAPDRGLGIGSWLVDAIVRDLTGSGVSRFVLATRDAHEVYGRVGFGPVRYPERWMEIDRRGAAASPP